MTLTRIDFKTKQERRVRFADSVGLELASIFLFDLINLATYHKKAIVYSKPPPPQPPPPPHTSNLVNNGGQSSSYGHSSHSSQGQGHYHSHSNSHYYYNQSNQINNQYQAANTILRAGAGGVGGGGGVECNGVQQPPTREQQLTASSFSCQFIQPITLLSFKERVKINKIHLETCDIKVLAASQVTLNCTIRVLNCSYNKSVTVRYTCDEWRTHTDICASYIPGSCDGWSDKFTCTLRLTEQQAKMLSPGQRVIFCVCYMYDGQHTHWDNNGGLNYSIKRNC